MAKSTITTANPGNMIVPLSTIIDLLQGKLSDADLNMLLLAIDGQKKKEVRSGELITADLMNQILNDLVDLSIRIDRLEKGSTTTGQVVIFEPAVGATMKVGEYVQIVGLNFGFSTAQQRVTFDDIPVSGYEIGSGDNLLRIIVPSLPNLGEGRAVVLKVSNAISSATRAVMVLPADQPVTGTIDIEALSPDPNPVLANQNADFPFLLSPRGLNRSAEFQLTAALGGQNWDANLRFLDANKIQQSSRKLSLTPDQNTKIYVRLAPVPAGSNDQSFSLALSVASGSVGGSSPVKSYIVGKLDDLGDPTLTLKIGNVSPSGTLVSGEIRLAGGNFATIPVNLTSAKAGGPYQYDLKLQLIPETVGGVMATGWTFGFLQPMTSPPSQPQATTGDVGTNGSIQFFIAVAANGSNTGRLRLLVQRKNEPLARTLDLNLKKLN